MRYLKSTVAGLAAAMILAAGCANHDGHEGHDHGRHATDSGSPAPSSEEVAAARPYPLDVCIVSDEELGSMGAPIVRVYDGQEIKFCCKGCIADFEEAPAQFLAKLKP